MHFYIKLTVFDKCKLICKNLSMTKLKAQKSLKQCGLRTTRDRCLLLQLFSENRTWTVAELHDRLPQTDISTIYRNVTTLTINKLLCEASVKGKEARYELADREHHAHSVCASCGTAYCIPCPLKNLNHNHSLEIYQICDKCRRQKAS